MNWIYVIFYVFFSVSGSTLLKFGSSESAKALFTLPIVNMPISLLTFLGFGLYALSFFFYTVLLSKYDLSIISPLTVGLVYVLLMITAFIFFKEQLTVYKLIGSSLILLGILMIIIKK